MRSARIALAVLVVVVLWAVAGTVVLVRSVSTADDARAELDRLRDEVTPAALLGGEVRARLESIRADLRDVGSAASGPLTAPLRVLPGIGRQLRSVDEVAEVGAEALGIGITALEEVEALFSADLPTGPERFRLLDDLIEVVRDGRQAVAALDLGPEPRLLASLQRARASASDGIVQVESALADAEAVARSLRALLGGEGDYLLLASNNAEMRAGSGMFLQVGSISGVNGSLVAGDFQPSIEVLLPPGLVDPRSDTYGELWGFLEPSSEWRNLAASPRFDVTAELASRMWTALGRPGVQGVLSVDPFGLQAVLAATGPVQFGQLRITADNVIPFLLHDQYTGTEQDRESIETRKEQLGDLAALIFERLGSSRLDPAVLVEGLQRAARGRHVMIWSADPEAQAGWVAAGLAGVLVEDSMMVSVLNRSANKLDPFIEVEADLEVERRGADPAEATLTVTVTNTVPDGEIEYIAGPVSVVEQVKRYGDYFAILAVTLPGTARNAVIEGQDELYVAAPDGPTLTVAGSALVRQGQTKVYRIRFELPAVQQSVVIEPSARPVPVEWRAGGKPFEDTERHRIDLTVFDG